MRRLSRSSGNSFVLLQDCGHVLELANIDNIMMGVNEIIQLPACPYCRKPIMNTYRYKDRINQIVKTDINPVKERVYGNANQIQKKKKDLTGKIAKFQKLYSSFSLKDNNPCKDAFQKLISAIKTQKKVSLLQLDMEFIYLDILEMTTECYKTYLEANLTELKEELLDVINIISKVLLIRLRPAVTLKISRQQQEDVQYEIKRLNAIIQFSKLLSNGSYLVAKDAPNVSTATQVARSAVLSIAKYDEHKAMDALKKLQEAINVADVVVKQQRELIVKAIGLKSGHWYKCPNGHFYCIGECGGAMQVGKCECGARIGGTSHALLPENAHAPEMDGSRFAAWSEQANNMANFNFDN